MKAPQKGANFSARSKLVTLAIASALTVVGCTTGTQEASKKANRQAPRVHVDTTTIQRITVQRQVDLAGTLISPDQARVSSEVAGIVRQVLADIGQDVRPGQPLVLLDTKELEIAVRRAESQLRQTEAQLGIDGAGAKEPPPDEEISMVRTAAANRDDARAQLARATQLLKKGLVSQETYDSAATRVKVTEAAYQSALETLQSLRATLQERRAAYELAQKKLDDAVIRAPVGGTISERLVQTGEFIRENTQVVTIVQINPLKLRTAVQERYAELLHPGLPARFQVEAIPGATFEGKVTNVSPSIDQTTRTFPVEVLVDNSGRRLKPGFFAKGVIFTQRDENVMAVPELAVSTMAGVSTVFVIDSESRVKQQVVSLGAREGNLIEVVSGLEGTEKLATTNLNQLATGMQVDTGTARGAETPGGAMRQERDSAGKGEGGEA